MRGGRHADVWRTWAQCQQRPLDPNPLTAEPHRSPSARCHRVKTGRAPFLLPRHRVTRSKLRAAFAEATRTRDKLAETA